MKKQKNRIDGILTANGLKAEFRLLYQHPDDDDVYFIETAAGEHYVYGNELTFYDELNMNYERP